MINFDRLFRPNTLLLRDNFRQNRHIKVRIQYIRFRVTPFIRFVTFTNTKFYKTLK